VRLSSGHVVNGLDFCCWCCVLETGQIDRVLAVRYSDEWAKENLDETGDSDTDGAFLYGPGELSCHAATFCRRRAL
jgi:hypothetical protein